MPTDRTKLKAKLESTAYLLAQISAENTETHRAQPIGRTDPIQWVEYGDIIDTITQAAIRATALAEAVGTQEESEADAA